MTRGAFAGIESFACRRCLRIIDHDRRTKTGADFRDVDIAIVPSRSITFKPIVHRFQHRFFFARNSTRDRKDWQYAALVADDTGVVAFSQFPASFDRNRSVAAIGAEKIFEIDTRGIVSAWHDRDDRNVADGSWPARIGDAKLHPLFRNTFGGV